MRRKFSQNLIWKAIEFARTAKEELGDDLGEDRIAAMFDAFDPSLQRQLLMEMMMGHTGGSMRIRLIDPNNRQAINAIKAVRGATRYGLREAKDIIDAAHQNISVIDGSWDSDTYYQLKRDLVGTGYELL